MTQEREGNWANPRAISPLLIACSAMGLAALWTGKVPSGVMSVDAMGNQIIEMGSIALIGWMFAAMVGITIAAIIHLRRGEMLFGIMGIVFGPLIASWGFMSPLMRFVIPYFGPHMESAEMAGMVYPMFSPTTYLDGWVLFMVAALFAIFVISSLKMPRVMTLLFVQTMAAFIMAAVVSLQGQAIGSTGLSQAVGWLFISIGITFFYIGAANILGPVYGRPILPLGKPILK
jgi:succinate-acetate transporter protein